MPPNPPASACPDPSAAFPTLDRLIIPPVTWLWPGWIPRGMITLLCAAPGAGKSYLALDLAHRLIAGLPWPDGTPQSAAGAPPTAAGSGLRPNVIYADAEGAPQILAARAAACGMDRTHLFPMLPTPDHVAPDGMLDLTAPACQDRLFKMCVALSPALVIVDSLGSAARGSESRVAAVDALFASLNEIAVTFQCALLVIHHLRKRSCLAAAEIGLDDVRGSGHIVTVARSILGLAEVRELTEARELAAVLYLDPGPAAPRRLELLKTNLGPHPDPLGVTFVPQANGGAGLAYGPAPEPIHPCTAVESCARWLLDVLGLVGRPISPADLKLNAYEAGFSRATLYRARALLGSQVLDTHGRHHPDNCWTLGDRP